MAVIMSKLFTPPVKGKKASEYVVGDSVFIPIDGIDREFLVVHQGNPNVNLYDDSCNGTWLLMKDCSEIREWDPTNTNNSYADSAIHSYLNGTFYATFCEAGKAAIKEVKIPYRPGTGSGKSCNTKANGLLTKIFLPSMEELSVTASDKPTSEGAALNYFANSGSIISKYNGGAVRWWTRTPFCSTNSAIYFITETGTNNRSGATLTLYIRPCFVIKPTTLFDPKNDVIKE